MRTIDFSYTVLRNGAPLGFLQTPEKGVRTLRMNDRAEIKMSLAGTFSPRVVDVSGNTVETDFMGDEIRPALIIDGVEHNLGVFAIAQATPAETNGIRSVQIEAFDRCWRVRDTYTETRLHIDAGQNYIDEIERLLVTAGIVVILATPTDATFPEAREDWEVGTSILTIVNQLLGEINYNQLWFTPDGSAVLEPASVPTAENIEHTMSDRPEDQLGGAVKIDRMLPSISRVTDVYQAPNVFLCLCSNPDKSGPMKAISENTNPQSPLSISRRGRRIMTVKRVDNIASQEELQAYADRMRNESMIGGETIRVSTALQPGYGAADVVSITYGEISAICIERAFTMDLSVGGAMTHELERVVYHLG